MKNKDQYDVLVSKLTDLWEGAIGGCFSIMHPHYSNMGAIGITFPIEWSLPRQSGKKNFIAWAVMEVKKSHPDFVIEAPSLDYYDEAKGSEISNWVISSKEARDGYVSYDKRQLVTGNYLVADIIAIRKDASENKMSTEDLSTKYGYTSLKVERALYFRASEATERVAPQLKTPYGKKVL